MLVFAQGLVQQCFEALYGDSTAFDAYVLLLGVSRLLAAAFDAELQLQIDVDAWDLVVIPICSIVLPI
jgi:hypothetical protein